MIWFHSCAMLFTSCFPSNLLLFGGNCWEGSDTRDSSPLARCIGLSRYRFGKRSEPSGLSRPRSSALVKAKLNLGLTNNWTTLRANFRGYRSSELGSVNPTFGNFHTALDLVSTNPTVKTLKHFLRCCHDYHSLPNGFQGNGISKSKLAHVKFSSFGVYKQITKQRQFEHH